jgi:hypothetical protein
MIFKFRCQIPVIEHELCNTRYSNIRGLQVHIIIIIIISRFNFYIQKNTTGKNTVNSLISMTCFGLLDWPSSLTPDDGQQNVLEFTTFLSVVFSACKILNLVI